MSCATVQRTILAPPMVAGATFAGNKACYECHTNYTRVFAASPHARLRTPDARQIEQAGCESCHGPGSRHIAAGGGRGRFIHNPGKDPTICFNCHLQTHAEFALPQRHPVLEGKMHCAQCHDPHGFDIFKPAGGLALSRLNESCAECHREQARPVVYEHEALREGCTACHQPHGGFNRKMLVEADQNLCLKCHAQLAGPEPGLGTGGLFIGKTDHSSFVRMGGCWSGGCHTAVHGSNINPHLLY